MNKDFFGSALAAHVARGGLMLVMAVALFSSACTRKIAAPVVDSGASAARTAASRGVHIVRPGDTVLSISRQYGIAARDIIAWNHLANPNQIEVGQAVRIAPAGTAASNVTVAEAIPVRVDAVRTDPADRTPAAPAGAPGASVAVKNEPRGGKEPYSDEGWAKAQSASYTPVMATAPQQAEAPQQNAAAMEGKWIWPVKGKVIIAYDAPMDSNGKTRNKGIDIAGAPGTPVLAAAAGKVAYAGSGLRGLGKLVIIKHDADYLTAYAHNQNLLVKELDTVSQGQKIAELGSTDADRPKLHFELRRQGQPVDPLKHLPAP
jgi:lipoprotein NlpD